MKAGDVGVVVVTAEAVVGGVMGVVAATSGGEAALGKAVVGACPERKDIWAVVAPGHREADGPRAARCQQKVVEVCSLCRPRSGKRSDVVNWRRIQIGCQFNMAFPLRRERYEPSSRGLGIPHDLQHHQRATHAYIQLFRSCITTTSVRAQTWVGKLNPFGHLGT